MSARARVRLARVIRDEALRATELNSQHDGALHVLGRWNAEIQRLPGITKFFAKTFPGERKIRRRDDLLSALKDLQDALGGLNDLETRHGLMNGTGGDRPPVEMEAAIPDPAREAASREWLLTDAEKAFARLAQAKAFWKE